MTLIQNVHDRLFHFCDENGHKSNLESVFENIFFNNYSSQFCTIHHCDNMIVKYSLPFLLYKYVKDKKKPVVLTSGHYEKTNQFKSLWFIEFYFILILFYIGMHFIILSNFEVILRSISAF